MLRIAQSKPCCNKVTFLNERAESVSLPSAVADLIVSSFAFHWFDSPRALAEISRLLKATGKALLVIPTVSGARADASGNVLLRRTFIRNQRAQQRTRTTSIGLTVDALRDGIASAGLGILDCSYVVSGLSHSLAQRSFGLRWIRVAV
jgi:SAM-dependent methyltransferase